MKVGPTWCSDDLNNIGVLNGDVAISLRCTYLIVYPLINCSIIVICRWFFLEDKVNGGDWQVVVQKEPHV
jgi:hypothetical protein